MKKAYTAVYALIAVLITATAIISYNGKENRTQQNQNEQVNNSNDIPYREITTESKPEPTTISEKKIEKSTQPITVAEISSSPETEKIIEKAEFSLFDNTEDMAWPVNGKVVMNYSMDTAVYDATLDQYRTNDSISISAESGTPVCVSADGVVELVYVDEIRGKSIVVNHGNGWLTTYGQLDDDVYADIGDTVSKGQEIARVSEPTKYSSELGSHLDFKVTCNNEPFDPNLVLAQLDE